MAVEIPPHDYNLAIAHPPTELLPSNKDLLAWAAAFATDSVDLSGYGEHAGMGEARIAIAEWLAQAYAGAQDMTNGRRWEPSGLELVLCAGVSGGLNLLAHHLDKWYLDGTGMGGTVLVEKQTYELAVPIFEAAGLQVVRIASDRHGVDPESVAAELKSRGGAGKGVDSVRFLYLVPTHGNPTGACLSSERRERLAELSEEHRFYIVADEVYGLLGFDRIICKPLSALAVDSILSVFSVSKICSPGLRVGWIHCSHGKVRDMIADTPACISGGSPVPSVAAAAIAGAAESGKLDEQLERVRKTLGNRAKTLQEELDMLLEGTCASLWPCTGGYFLWLDVQTEAAAVQISSHLAHSCPRVQVNVEKDACGLRLCFASMDDDLLRQAARYVGAAVHKVCGRKDDLNLRLPEESLGKFSG